MAKKKILTKVKPKRKSKLHKKKGKAPGAIIYMGAREAMPSTMHVIEYAEDSISETQPENLDEIHAHKDPGTTAWVNVVGISDEAFIENLGKTFQLNPLVLEDAVDPHQRPKIDEYETYIFGVFKMLHANGEQAMIDEHVAIILFENNILTLQELKEDVFEGVRERIRKKSGRLRSRGADYLFFALIDSIVDSYLEVMEHIIDRLDVLEDEVYHNPKPATAQKIQELKKEVIRLHKFMFPLREMVHRLIDTENPLIKKETKLFLRDALDHCIEINESLQIYREMSLSLMELYMSNVSNKMNEVMKVLTIMASIFIPLTFIAGIYGMNFERMPELKWEYGYFGVLGLMFLILVIMLLYFKRKQWL